MQNILNKIWAKQTAASQELYSIDGTGYIRFITETLKNNNARNYFEIGTHAGSSLKDINCKAISIDPNYKIAYNIYNKEELHMYQITSDDFFTRHNPEKIFGEKIHFGFLDGMHHFEFLLRDFINTEKYCDKDATLFMHDCIPLNFEMTEREHFISKRTNQKFKKYWTGDVWKVSDILLKYRPDLEITLLDCPPTGLVMIKNLNPTDTFLSSHYDKLIKDYSPSPNDLEKLKTYLSDIKVSRTATKVNVV